MFVKGLAGLAAIAAVVSASVPATAQDARVFKPSGKWTLDYGEDYCRLLRPFSDGTSEMALAFERIQPGPWMRLVLVGQDVGTKGKAEELSWSFEPATGPERKTRPLSSKTDENLDYLNLGPVMIAEFTPPPFGSGPAPALPYDREAERVAAKQVTGIALDKGMAAPLHLETGSLESAIGALQTCADDLAKSWGLDPATLAGATPAVPDPKGTRLEIPFQEFAKFAGGANQVRLMIDTAGIPTSCHIHWPSLNEATNKKICNTLMHNAKFTPAKDAGGTAIPGFWVGNPMFLTPPMPGRR
jgi:hypothetical protein